MVVTTVHLTTVAIAESELSYLRRPIGAGSVLTMSSHGPHANAEEWSGLNSRARRFYFSRQDRAAIGNILRETSVHNLSVETSASKGALREPNEDCQDDSSSFDVQLAYWRRMYAGVVG